MENNSILPGIIFIIIIIMLVVRSKRNETRPKNASERGFVEDVIATIQRTAPDFDGARVGTSTVDYTGRVLYSGCITFKSLSGQNFVYDYAAHGYVISYHMAHILALEIVKRFGGECRDIYSYNHGDRDLVGCEVISARQLACQLAAEQEKKRQEDSLKRL